jgi:4-methylaminobutanoate oxidase (formaldehyde-forming)
MLWGGELLVRDGVAAGQVISAAWGQALGACVGLAYVWTPDGSVVSRDWVLAGGFEADVNGHREPVSVSLRPPFDPDGQKIRT